MTAQKLIAALALPESCRIDQRVPKHMLIENGAPTAADKRLLSDAISEVQWVAALKPNTVGVPIYRDEQREYLEVSVLSVATECTPARTINHVRLAELVHRAVPYPVLLILETPNATLLSCAHKRWSQNEASKVVLDGDVSTVDVPDDLGSDHPLACALDLVRQPQTNLLTLYQGWMDCLSARRAALYTGSFRSADTPTQAAERRDALNTCQRLEQEIARLHVRAAKEKQMSRQIEINLALQRINAELVSVREQL